MRRYDNEGWAVTLTVSTPTALRAAFHQATAINRMARINAKRMKAGVTPLSVTEFSALRRHLQRAYGADIPYNELNQMLVDIDLRSLDPAHIAQLAKEHQQAINKMRAEATKQERDYIPHRLTLSGMVTRSNLAANSGMYMADVLRRHPVLYAILREYDRVEGQGQDFEYLSLKKKFKKLGKAVKKGAKFLKKSGLIALVPGLGVPASVASAAEKVSKTVKKIEKAKKKFKSIKSAVETQPPQTEKKEKEVPPQIEKVAAPVAVVKTVYKQQPEEEPETEYPTVEGATEEAEEAAETFEVTAGLYGPEEAVTELESEYPEEFEAVEEFAEFGEDAFFDTVDCDTDHCEYDREVFRGIAVDDFRGELPTGEFYKSRLVRARLVPTLGGGVFGQVNLAKTPFQVDIAANSGQARAAISLAHEIAHICNKLYKLGLSHDKVHQVGVFYATEGLQAMKEYNDMIGGK